jgi:phosphatidylglycerophosphatase A
MRLNRLPQTDTPAWRQAFGKADLRGRAALLLATWFGVGSMPVTPGTFGTVASLPLILILKHTTALHQVVALIVFIPLAIWSSGLCARLVQKDDPSEIVIDEVAGFLLTTLFLPASWSALVLAFILFRVFDILKPFPIGALDKNIPGGTGIVMDDLLAGVYAYLGTRLLLTLFNGS